ncbi:cytochrome P450 [Symbiopectobacterium purcellii]|uniref:Cytochrome P450 n=1 Tax=Symbiopectobacterium purcellii TaxID=2871826 RepID=A0ABX9AQW1_9ENTR|nr:cytochrome P450 [Symbiopectobacterium purcellii]QZN97558.1 cytochrome P450 [Symbiopectobacterium purcellii]
MSEHLCDSERCATYWPLPDVDLTDLTLFSQGFPHDVFTQLRQNDGVLYHPATPLTPDNEGFWVFTRYQDIVPLARDIDTFSSHRGGARTGGGTMIEDLPSAAGPGTVINMMDDPRHKALRRLMAPGITRGRIAALEPVLTVAARQAIVSALTKGEGDFVSDIAAELPLFAIAHLVGIPPEDRHPISGWINAVLDYADRQLGQSSASSQQGMQQFMAYAQRFVEQRRQAPGDDIVSLAIAGELSAELGSLTPMEQVMVFSVVMVAGLETTRNAIAGGILTFIQHPQQWLLLQREPVRMNRALEEILRWTSPTPYNRRTATRDVDVAGKRIKAGEKVTLWWASANRDEQQFENPFAFDICREKNAHLAFGSGGHSCLGAQLATLEMRVVFRELLNHIDTFALNGPVEWVRSNKHTGIRRMPLRYKGL